MVASAESHVPNGRLTRTHRLAELEQDLAQREQALSSRLEEAGARAADLRDRVHDLGRKAAAAVADASAPKLGALTRLVPPALDAEEELGRLLEVREWAMKARRRVADELERRLEETDRALIEAAGELSRCSQELADWQSRAAEEAAARAADDSPAPPIRPADRRQSERVPVNVAMTFESEDNFYTGFSRDLSEGGVFMATVQLLAIGTAIDMTITLPDGSTITTSGEVRWCREYRDDHPDMYPGMGIRFSELNEPARQAISRFLARREAWFYPEN